MRIVALSGSLRQFSVNTALLQALAQSAPAGIQIEVFSGLRTLPPFNPDLEEQDVEAVTAFRRALAQAEAVVVSCPEYAHGLPGAFKNALDWVVGSAEFDGKPTLVLCASARSDYAPAQVAEVLRTMGAEVSGPVKLDLPRDFAQAQAVLAQPDLKPQLAALASWLNER